MIQLNLGCWHRNIPGFINVDLCDVTANSKFVTIFSKNLDIDISLDTKNLIEVLRKAGLIDEVK